MSELLYTVMLKVGEEGESERLDGRVCEQDIGSESRILGAIVMQWLCTSLKMTIHQHLPSG